MPVRNWSQGLPGSTTASEQSGLDGVFKSGPNTLKYRSWPVYGVPFGLVAGRSGLPKESTDWMVGVPLVVVTWQPDHLKWALIFLLGYLVAGVALAVAGRLLLRVEPPRRTLEALKETREWALRQISSNSR